MTIAEKKQAIKDLQSKIDALHQEIKDDEKRAKIAELTHLVSRSKYESFVSTKGNQWWKLPKSADKNSWCTRYFLTDLRGHYIDDKTTYEGRPCQPGWAVGALYCSTEQRAIDAFEEYSWHTKE